MLPKSDDKTRYDNHLQILAEFLFTEAMRCAEPFMLIDMTSRTHRRGVFCLSPFDCQDMLRNVLSQTGARCGQGKACNCARCKRRDNPINGNLENRSKLVAP